MQKAGPASSKVLQHGRAYLPRHLDAATSLAKLPSGVHCMCAVQLVGLSFAWFSELQSTGAHGLEQREIQGKVLRPGVAQRRHLACKHAGLTAMWVICVS